VRRAFAIFFSREEWPITGFVLSVAGSARSPGLLASRAAGARRAGQFTTTIRLPGVAQTAAPKVTTEIITIREIRCAAMWH
jgi:hypothetical protein